MCPYFQTKLNFLRTVAVKVIRLSLLGYFTFCVIKERQILKRSHFHYGIIHDIESMCKYFQTLLCICLILISKIKQYGFLSAFQNYSPRLKENCIFSL